MDVQKFSCFHSLIHLHNGSVHEESEEYESCDMCVA